MPSHSFNVIAQGGDQKISAFFDLRHTFLANTQRLGDLLLRKLTCLPKLLKCHFLSNELLGTVLNFPPLRRTELFDNFVYICRHTLTSFFSDSILSVSIAISAHRTVDRLY